MHIHSTEATQSVPPLFYKPLKHLDVINEPVRKKTQNKQTKNTPLKLTVVSVLECHDDEHNNNNHNNNSSSI